MDDDDDNVGSTTPMPLPWLEELGGGAYFLPISVVVGACVEIAPPPPAPPGEGGDGTNAEESSGS